MSTGRVAVRNVALATFTVVRTLPPFEREATMFKRILVPMDFSPPSDAALEYARNVAARYGASLHLLHVAEDPYRAFYTAEVYVPEIEGLREEILTDTEQRLKERVRPSDVTEFHATAESVIGSPAGSIVEYAAGRDIDLIVMGTHGRGGMAHLLMGSVAERVVRTAPCPVLTVREAKKAAAAAAA
jgi:nucleotide-binding universal stress UspA family protein